MKSFWISLLFFILLMCSCATKKASKSKHLNEQVSGQISYMNSETKVDTSKVVRIDSLGLHIIIEEELTIVEYDKESGKPIKETHAKREIRQDSDKVVEETEAKGITETAKDSTNHIVDANKMVSEETKSEIKSDSSTFSKYFGITFGCVIGLLLVYLLSKYRIN